MLGGGKCEAAGVWQDRGGGKRGGNIFWWDLFF